MNSEAPARRGRKPSAKPKSVVLNFRITADWERRLEKVLDRHPMKDRTELLRAALIEYIEAEERRLKISVFDVVSDDLLRVAEEPPPPASGGKRPAPSRKK